MVRVLVAAIATAFAITTGSAGAGGARVPGADFETVTPPASWRSVDAGGSFAGWRVTRGTVDVVGGYWRAWDGRVSVEIGTPGAGAIEQTIHTVPGRAYVLRFALAGNPDGPPRRKLLDVEAGATRRRFTFDVRGSTRARMRWAVERLPFVAQAPATTIRFVRPDGGATDWWGPVIDAVSVIEAYAAPPRRAAVHRSALPHPAAAIPPLGWGCPDC